LPASPELAWYQRQEVAVICTSVRRCTSVGLSLTKLNSVGLHEKVAHERQPLCAHKADSACQLLTAARGFVDVLEVAFDDAARP
jgi:hypothetical protein